MLIRRILNCISMGLLVLGFAFCRQTQAELVVSAEQMPRVAPSEPSVALRTFHFRPGFRAELVAAEPLVASPVAVAVDEGGAAFVVEMRDYSERRPERLGRVRRLTDTTGEGRYDHADVFLADLPWPTAIACWDGGVFIGATPDIIYAKDTNGDGIADIHEVVFTGFASDYAPFETNRLNVQALFNSFQWGLDHRIHGSASVSGGKVRMVDSAFTRNWRSRFSAAGAVPTEAIDLRGRDFSFDPRTLSFRAETGGGQHGMSLDDVGRKYVCSNSDHLQQVLFDEVAAPANRWHDLPTARVSIAVDGPAAEVFRLSPDEPWRVLRTRWRVAGLVPGPVEGGGRPSGYFTGATGATIYRGDAWPSEYRGDAFIADCGSNLVHRKKLRSVAGGIRMEAARADDERTSEFMASTDNWFRPVQFYNAPDGCLWVIDMYRETIEHPWSLPAGLKQHLDLDSGRERGRLWRLRPELGGPVRRPQDLRRMSPAEWVGLLSHPNGWHRDTASRLLYEHGGRAGVAELRSALRASTNALTRLHALGALDGFGVVDDGILVGALADRAPDVRRNAARLVRESELELSPKLRPALILAAEQETDEGARVELAFALARLPALLRTEPLAALIRRKEDLGQSAAIHAAAADLPDLFRELTGSNVPPAYRVEFPGSTAVMSDLVSTLGRRAAPATLAVVGVRLPQFVDHPLAIALAAAVSEGANGAPAVERAALATALSPVVGWALETVSAGTAGSGLDAAARLLSRQPWASVRDPLRALLDSKRPVAVQEAGVAAMARFQEAEAVSILTQALPALAPDARHQALEALLRRPEGALAALEATGRGSLPAREWTVDQMDKLRRHRVEAVRTRAAREFGAVPADRQTVVETFLPALRLKGDAALGAVLFRERCATCHRFKEEGTVLGPDLASVVANGPEKLLVSILDPNREVAPNFVAWTVESTDGESVTGLWAGENDSGVTLKLAGGQETRIPRAKVARMKPEGRSLMPEGLESGWGSQQMADLLSHLLGNNAR